MKRTKHLLVIFLLLFFAAGCIDGLTVLSLNQDRSGKVTFEGLFDYPAYSMITSQNNSTAVSFFIEQIEAMLADSGFEVWNDVSWKFLDDGRCYFKGTAYFKDINKTDFFLGSTKSNLKILFDNDQQPKPTVELKYLENGPIESLPAELFESARISLVITLPGDVDRIENFELLDLQTATFVFDGRDLAGIRGKNKLSGYFRDKGTIKLFLASAQKDLFDYTEETGRARQEYKKILNQIAKAKKAQAAVTQNITVTPASLQEDFMRQMRAGLLAQGRKDFKRAVKIYKGIINNPRANEKFISDATYQIGACLFESGLIDKAIEQFEFVIDNFPLQRTAALKSVNMLKRIRTSQLVRESLEKEAEEVLPFVIDSVPGLYTEDVNAAVTDSITIVFSEPMETTSWFYSSFSPMLMPKVTAPPVFDKKGLEWTLPVKLRPGKIYALSINCGDAAEEIKNLQAGFRNVSGEKSKSYVLVFATVNDQNEPTLIEDILVERCEKINFPQEETGEQENR
ncbi:MAG: hypothetical protein JW806_01175 [Sedimentisphaerales bacterium]|nr:hypothetical protein [Sedimentisphaerales bacterium]